MKEKYYLDDNNTMLMMMTFENWIFFWAQFWYFVDIFFIFDLCWDEDDDK